MVFLQRQRALAVTEDQVRGSGNPVGQPLLNLPQTRWLRRWDHQLPQHRSYRRPEPKQHQRMMHIEPQLRHPRRRRIMDRSEVQRYAQVSRNARQNAYITQIRHALGDFHAALANVV